MSTLSILIPARNEEYLRQTVDDIYAKAATEVEVIVAFDGPPYPHLDHHPNLVRLCLEQHGSKIAITKAAEHASGEYLMKVDAHCMFSPGFDRELLASARENWVVTPRFYVLDAENWRWQDNRFYDYFFLPCPLTDEKGFRFQAGGHWLDRTRQRVNVPLDENMKLHGSLWMMHRDHFLKRIGGLHPNGAGAWSGEDIEISLKTWLGPWDGRLMVTKNAWYAHMHKGGQRPRGYEVSASEIRESYLWTARYWMRNEWSERAHDLDWLIERFEPVPRWPEGWREIYHDWRTRH